MVFKAVFLSFFLSKIFWGGVGIFELGGELLFIRL